MILIDSILAAPGKGLVFLLQEITRRAEEEFLDDQPVKRSLQEAYRLYDSGAMGEREFDEIENRLVARLEAIQRARARQR